MSPRRNKEKFQQLTEFEWVSVIDLGEGGISYHAIGARVQEQLHSDASLEAVDKRAPNNSNNWQWRTETEPMCACMCLPSESTLTTATSFTNVGLVDVCCSRDYVQECLDIGSPSGKPSTIASAMGS
ncbi:hypothetical protein TNCV_3504421 [Trichonephila clavipes]|uniref:Uncharacterized protein n=1 Tax=Trichonephila clavipes TaxID=2585209 RepID=A0A8X6S474_TRICX|nr:hypothetical protein TNCV_3504421 [Trichonephila clavipes]